MKLLNGKGILSGKFLFWLLGNGDLQNAVFKLCTHILNGNSSANIEATAHCTGVTLLTNVTALLILLVLIQALLSADGQITVLQLYLNLVLFKAGQVDVSS